MSRVVGPCLLLLATALACSSDPTANPVSPGDESDSGLPGVPPLGDAAVDGPRPADKDGGNPLPATCVLCAQYGTPQNQGPLPDQLLETSGIAASRVHPGVLYAHNDSGDVARVIAVDDHGALLATLNLGGGAQHQDYEDIAVAPCPQGSCVYVGDIGDNSLNRLTKVVYRFLEPALTPGQAATDINVTAVEALPFAYPGGLLGFHNAETLLVHPTSGDIYVVTKEDVGTKSMVFKFPKPLTPGVSATLIEVAKMAIPIGNDPDISGGDIHPCGNAVLFRVSNAHVYQLTVPSGQPFDSVFSLPESAMKKLPMAAEGNPEAISWSADGQGYFTASEGKNAILHHVGCL